MDSTCRAGYCEHISLFALASSVYTIANVPKQGLDLSQAVEEAFQRCEVAFLACGDGVAMLESTQWLRGKRQDILPPPLVTLVTKCNVQQVKNQEPV